MKLNVRQQRVTRTRWCLQQVKGIDPASLLSTDDTHLKRGVQKAERNGDCLEKGKLMEESHWCKCLKGECKENGAGLFLVVPSARIGGNSYELKSRRFPLTMRKHLFSLRVFRSQLDVVLGNWL
uniref:Uncharacterized protein n=1 Tax=Anopheles stephensi TaxID=30069 RepID=A0A182YT99_ANOST